MNYIDSTVWKKLEATFFFSRLIHCYPFEWNKDRKLPQVISSQWAILHWYFNMCLALLNTSFIQLRSIQVLLSPGSSTIQYMYMQLMAFWYMVASVMQLTYINQRKGVENFIQNHMKLMQDMWDEIGKKFTVASRPAWISNFLTGSFQVSALNAQPGCREN